MNALECDMTDRRKYLKEHYSQLSKYDAALDSGDQADFSPLPEDITCGARTKRTGLPCKQKAIYKNGRCKYHAGLSTGPRTVAGKSA